MEKVYRVNGHVVQFVDEMCGDSWKEKGYQGPVICNYDDGAEYQGEWQDGKRHGIILYLKSLGKKFESKKGVVDIMEKMLINYYQGILQHLKRWEKPAPQITQTKTAGLASDTE